MHPPPLLPIQGQLCTPPHFLGMNNVSPTKVTTETFLCLFVDSIIYMARQKSMVQYFNQSNSNYLDQIMIKWFNLVSTFP